MKFKRKSKYSSNRIDKSLLLQLFVVIGVCMLITCAAGCRTGGTRVNPNSAGKIIRTSDIRPDFQPLPPVPIVPPRSIPIVMTNAVKSAPVPPKSQPIEANPIVVDPKPAGKEKSLTPTITTPTKLPPIRTKEPPKRLIEGDDGRIKPVPQTPSTDNKATSPEIVDPREVAPEEKRTGINWLSLLSFYVVCFLGLVILWVIYDIVKDSVRMKKQGSPIKDHLENLKKPAKGTKASRKKATTKKKPTKKKSK